MTVRRAAACLVLCLVVAACTATPLAWPVPRVTTSPRALEFTDAIFDETNLATVIVVNHGTDDVRLAAATDPPFLVAERTLDVAAGTTRALLVSWRPDSYEPVTGALQLTGPLTDEVLAISGAVDADADADDALAIGAGGADCDDRRPDVRPGAAEVCDTLDNDCDGTVDEEALDVRDWFPDSDGDSWGVSAGAVAACDAPGTSWATRGGDCDDTDPDVNPAELEIWYDGVDADCSGGSDDDRDGDGYDNLGTGGDDCQDEDPAVNPGQPEVAGNGTDDDCDGTTDERR